MEKMYRVSAIWDITGEDNTSSEFIKAEQPGDAIVEFMRQMANKNMYEGIICVNVQKMD